MEQLTKILERLHDTKVEFSLIGGLASRHYGVSLVTEDVDICARFSLENLRRIEAAFKEFHPRHRLTANRLPFELTEELCGSLKNIYLTTDLGVLDCLSQVAGVGDFDAVLKRSELKIFPFGRCYVLKIDALIQAKNAVGRPQDLIAVRQLQAIKEKQEQQGDVT
ncbi:MAG: hypothetical protein KGR98_08880 [Verrucomicrobia bacterium]|nr:hypothetical protein [Verrucomicrobiota bacterium]MDE3099962.1 hypothetical protein [Verrucomicrobiota bacterium]